jgi:hypothetical protein
MVGAILGASEWQQRGKGCAMRVLAMHDSAIATLEKEKACVITDFDGENNWVNGAQAGGGIDGLSVVIARCLPCMGISADDFEAQSSVKSGLMVGGGGRSLAWYTPYWLTGIRGLIQCNKGAWVFAD